MKVPLQTKLSHDTNSPLAAGACCLLVFHKNDPSVED